MGFTLLNNTFTLSGLLIFAFAVECKTLVNLFFELKLLTIWIDIFVESNWVALNSLNSVPKSAVDEIRINIIRYKLKLEYFTITIVQKNYKTIFTMLQGTRILKKYKIC